MATTGALRKAIADRDVLRDRVCAKKPGSPDDYRLRVGATCVPVSGKGLALANEEKQKKKAAARNKRYTPAQVRAEVKALEREMARSYPEEATVRYDALADGEAVAVSFSILRAMLSPEMRAAHHDPVERFNALIKILKKKEPGIDVTAIQRHMVMRATLEHLMALH
jgi:hypothetical protein